MATGAACRRACPGNRGRLRAAVATSFAAVPTSSAAVPTSSAAVPTPPEPRFDAAIGVIASLPFRRACSPGSPPSRTPRADAARRLVALPLPHLLFSQGPLAPLLGCREGVSSRQGRGRWARTAVLAAPLACSMVSGSLPDPFYASCASLSKLLELSASHRPICKTEPASRVFF